MIRIIEKEDVSGGFEICGGKLPEAKKAITRPLLVAAYCMQEDFEICTEEHEFEGQIGDWLVKTAQGEYKVVSAYVFAKSYDICTDDGLTFGDEHDGK